MADEDASGFGDAGDDGGADRSGGASDDEDDSNDSSSGGPVSFLRTAFRPERVGAWLLVLAAILGATAIATGFGSTVATDAPEAEFSGSFDADANALTVTHEGGDAIGEGPTDELVVAVTDADAGLERNVTWVAEGSDAPGAFPVEPGDSFVVDDPTVDGDGDGDYFDGDETVGFELDAGDAVRVVWRGRPLGAPDRIEVTLDSFEVGGAA